MKTRRWIHPVPGEHTLTSPCLVLGEDTNTLSTLFNLEDVRHAELDKPKKYMVHIAELGKSCTMHPNWSMGNIKLQLMQCNSVHGRIVQFNKVLILHSTWQNSTIQYIQYSTV